MTFFPAQSNQGSNPLLIGGVDIRDVAACSCLGLRRSAREATQIFDSLLEAVGLTIGQFGILAQLYGVKLKNHQVTVKDLAAILGMDPTTLNRALKPLEQQRLVASREDPKDRRARIIALTPAGEKRLGAATPIWAEAQRALQKQLGGEAHDALRHFFAASSAKA